MYAPTHEYSDKGWVVEDMSHVHPVEFCIV